MSHDDGSDVPNSRLFILGGKDLTKDEWEDTFSEFGTIKDTWIVKDRHTGDNKGVTYITFSRASEALLAQEKLNGEKICGIDKPLKIMVASEKREGCRRDSGEEEQHQRIFIKVPKKMTREEVEKEFSQWGEVDSVNILSYRDTGEPKGLAYVRYFRPYHAALAMENCRSSYRAMFATRKPTRPDNQGTSFELRHYGGNSSGGGGTGAMGGGGPRDLMTGYGGSLETRLEIMTPSQLSQEQLHRLLDLIPGLEFCDLDRRSGIAYVRYASPQCAAYAKEKLSGFEYPLGHRLGVRFPPKAQESSSYGRGRDSSYSSLSYEDRGFGSYNMGSYEQNSNPDPYYSSNNGTTNNVSALSVPGADPLIKDNLQTLVASIQQATSVLQAAGLATPGAATIGAASSSGRGGLVRVSYCNIPLPEMMPLAPKGEPCAERLFIVSQPESFPEHILRDALCRFGNLIDSYFMPGKNYGYAKFASKDSAQRCLEMLHEQQICNQRVKVIKADPPKHEEDYDSRGHKKMKS